jgi:hypothetical protein
LHRALTLTHPHCSTRAMSRRPRSQSVPA